MPETNQSRAASFVKAKLGPPIARHEALALLCEAMRELKLGTLTAHVTGGTDREGGGTGPVVVLLHGYGAPGTDLVPLWRELAVPREVRFVFPEAPLALGNGGRAWWQLDMARLQDRFSDSAVERLIAEVPPVTWAFNVPSFSSLISLRTLAGQRAGERALLFRRIWL